MNKAEQSRDFILGYRNYVLKDQQRAIGALVFDAVDVDMSPKTHFKDDDGEDCSLRGITFEFSDASRLRVIIEEDTMGAQIADAVLLPSKRDY